MKPKLFISQTSFLREEAEERLDQLSKIGINSSLSDEDVELVPIKIPYDKIVYSYPVGEGFKVGVLSAGSFWCLDDPFDEDNNSCTITITDKSKN